jgi:hypothetical protein
MGSRTSKPESSPKRLPKRKGAAARNGSFLVVALEPLRAASKHIKIPPCPSVRYGDGVRADPAPGSEP